MSLSVRMVDPSFSMFHYEMELLGALRPHIDDLILFAPPVIRDPTYPLPSDLPPVRGISLRKLADSEGRILGRSVQGYEYFANEFYALARLSLHSSRHSPRALVHVQFLSLFASSPFDDRWLVRLKKASSGLIYTVHNVLPHGQEENAALSARYRRVYELADHLIVHAGYQRQLLVDRFGIVPGKISTIAHGPLFHRLQLAPPAQARRRLGLEGPGPYLLHFGHMRPYKGTEFLLEALPEVLRQHPEATLLLAGPATAEREVQLRAQIASLGLERRTHARFGYLPTASLADYFAAADVVVLPYLQIDQSGVLLTALALGLPVIASDAGGVSETIRAQDIGYLAPAADAGALAATIIRVLSEPKAARQKAQRAQSYARETLGWQGIAEKTLAVYNHVLSA